MDTQHYFRQSETGTRFILGYPVTRGQRQFHSAAETKAVYKAYSRESERFEAVQNGMATAHEFSGFLLIAQRYKTLDIGTRYKAILFV
jgi:hypothetical protein